MAYNSENSGAIVFDIECAALPDAAEYLDLDEFTAPLNYRDEEKIKAYIAQKQAEALARCALDVDLCRVVAIGYQTQTIDEPCVLSLAEDIATSEAGMLQQFWSIIGARRLVGFNCLGYDLPVLFRRSLYLGVEVPSIGIDKYRHPSVTDLMQVLSFNGAIKPRSLAFYCRRFKIDVPDTLTGADIGQAVAEGNWAGVVAHCAADVTRTFQLAQRLWMLGGAG